MVKHTSYSTFLRSCCLDGDSEQKEDKIAAFRLTPLGASMALCNPVNTWMDALGPIIANCVTSSTSQALSRNTILFHLYLNVLRGNTTLHKSVASLYWQDRQMARAAFPNWDDQEPRTRVDYSSETNLKKQQDGY